MPLYSNTTDTELTTLLIGGEPSAYTEIYNRYHAVLYIHAFNKLRNREEARDIVHDLFSALWQKRTTLVITSSLSAYLYTSIRYKVFDLVARRQIESGYIRSMGHTGSEPQENKTDHLIREKQLADLIEQEIAALPPKMRAIFELSRKGHLTHLQIAEQLGLSEKTVKKQVSNSLKLLRGRLGKNLFAAFFL